MHTIDAAAALVAGRIVGPVRVVVDGARLVAVRRRRRVRGAATERLLSPGFVDLQVNGIDDVDVATASGDDWNLLDAHLVAQGVTSWCPTLVSSPLTAYPASLERIAAAARRAPRAGRPNILGAHLEGPFLGAAPGAHRREHLVPIDLTWLQSLGDGIALVTLGAEQSDAAAAAAALRRSGIAVAIGHSAATAEQFSSVVAAGAGLVTHLFNGMTGLHHRSPGVAAFALTCRDVAASLVADGVHVHPLMLRLAFDLLGARAVLVTDAVAWRAGTARLAIVDGAPRLPDGTIAGSILTADRAVRTCVDAGIPLAAALHAATAAPARVLGRGDIGVLVAGARADLVALDANHLVTETWVGGRPG